MQSLWLLIPLFFIFLFILPFVFQVKLSYNLTKNFGTLAVSIWSLKLIVATFKIKGKVIILRTKKDTKPIELAVSGPEIKVIEQFSVQIKDKIKLKKLEFNSNIGFQDAFTAALVSSFVRVVVSMIFGYVKHRKETSSIDIITHTNYNTNVFELSLFSRFSISIFDAIYSIIMAVIILKKSDSRKGYVSVNKE